MALRITGELISSDQTAHTARLARSNWHVWEVSWLPGWYVSHQTAIIAMTLAEAAAATELHPWHRLWPHIEGWAAELGLTAPDALARASQPPGHITSEKNATAQPSHPEAAGS